MTSGGARGPRGPGCGLAPAELAPPCTATAPPFPPPAALHRAMRVQLERCCGEWRELEEEFRQLQVRRALRGRRRERPLRGEGGKEGTGGGNARSPAVRWQRHPGVCDRVPLKHIVPSRPLTSLHASHRHPQGNPQTPAAVLWLLTETLQPVSRWMI